ncbi:uncharacterized protein LOC134243231 [Saccostrea cucullata]|uniref:uncharacterized protein LOC134243231 n=1 Tax=Saccostrea cuccullata TaxID=36930 RepID=UPI002ED5520F
MSEAPQPQQFLYRDFALSSESQSSSIPSATNRRMRTFSPLATSSRIRYIRSTWLPKEESVTFDSLATSRRIRYIRSTLLSKEESVTFDSLAISRRIRYIRSTLLSKEESVTFDSLATSRRILFLTGVKNTLRRAMDVASGPIMSLFMMFSVGSSINQCSNTSVKSCCSDFMWNERLKSCTKCSVGYFGVNCTGTCRYPNYGKDCQLRCYCDKMYCNASLGCIFSADERDKELFYYISASNPVLITIFVMLVLVHIFFLVNLGRKIVLGRYRKSSGTNVTDSRYEPLRPVKTKPATQSGTTWYVPDNSNESEKSLPKNEEPNYEEVRQASLSALVPMPKLNAFNGNDNRKKKTVFVKKMLEDGNTN